MELRDRYANIVSPAEDRMHHLVDVCHLEPELTGMSGRRYQVMAMSPGRVEPEAARPFQERGQRFCAWYRDRNRSPKRWHFDTVDEALEHYESAYHDWVTRGEP